MLIPFYNNIRFYANIRSWVLLFYWIYCKIILSLDNDANVFTGEFLINYSAVDYLELNGLSFWAVGDGSYYFPVKIMMLKYATLKIKNTEI